MLRFTTALSTNNNEPSAGTAFDKVRNAFVNGMNNAMFNKTGTGLDTENIKWNDKLDPKTLLNEADFINRKEQTNINYSNVFKTENILHNDVIPNENPFTLGTSVFDVTNKYREQFKHTVKFIATGVGENGEKYQNTVQTFGSPSLFNPYEAIDALGISQNIPLLDYGNTTSGSAIGFNNENSDNLNETVPFNTVYEDTHDCSIEHLVKLSKDPISILGNARYKYSDFMYCSEVGKLPNNHMITLRKFAHPIGDNIYELATDHQDYNNNEIAGDIGRMITWFGTEDNKLENIINYNYEATWKELKSEIQQQNSQEANGSTGVLGNLTNLFSPNAAGEINKGISTLSFDRTGRWGMKLRVDQGPYRDNPVVNGSTYDKNKVYEPKDTIRSTHIYEGELKFEHQIKLVFNYTLRSYDGINPKSAFLDLLANVLTVTYRNGSFWPGEQRILGVQPNKTGWKKGNAIIDSATNKAGLFISGFLSGNNAKVKAAENKASGDDNSGGSLKEMVQSYAKSLGDTIKRLGTNLLGTIGDILNGTLKNTLGRPAVYAFDSLLSGDAVGLWHLTVGNPLNPILSIGNLILDKAEIQQYGPLGFDDFPSNLKVTVLLKHATPRDSIEIQKMYTKGTKAIYTPIFNYNMKNTTSTDEDTKETKITDMSETVDEYIAVKGDGLLTDGADARAESIGWLGDYSSERIKTNRDALRI